MNTNYTMKRWQLAYHCNSDSSTPPLCEMMGTYQLSRWTGDQTVCTIQTIDLSLPWSNSNRDTIYKNGIRYLIKNGISQKKDTFNGIYIHLIFIWYLQDQPNVSHTPHLCTGQCQWTVKHQIHQPWWENGQDIFFHSLPLQRWKWYFDTLLYLAKE